MPVANPVVQTSANALKYRKSVRVLAPLLSVFRCTD